MEQLAQLFADHHLRLTEARKTVFATLLTAERPLFIHEINQGAPAIDRVSVYRTLELFSQLGIVDIIYTGFKKRYEIAGPFRPHHHHLQCTICHTLIAVDTPEIEKLIASISAQHHFHVTDHHFELHGTCKNCQNGV